MRRAPTPAANRSVPRPGPDRASKRPRSRRCARSVTEYADVVAELLPQPVLAAIITQHTPGTEPDPPPKPGDDEKASLGLVIALFLVVIVVWLVEVLGSALLNGLRWLLLGRGAKGERTSTASRVRHGADTGRKVLLAVTPTRLYLFEVVDSFLDRLSGTQRPAEQRLRFLYCIDRSAIRSARVTWYRLNPVRLVIDFTDGSWTSFANWRYMRRRHAQEFAEVLNRGVVAHRERP